MRRLILILLALLMLLPMASADSIHVTKTTMEFQGSDAVFTIDYELDFLVKVYVLALGSANLVPEIEVRFASFDDVTIQSLDCEQARVIVGNVSRYDGGYYFHNSHDFGMVVKKLVVDPPDGSPRTYLKTNSTPNIFYEDVWS